MIKLIQIGVVDLKVEVKDNMLVYYSTGSIIYPKIKLEFSILKLNYSIFQLLAMVVGFSIFQGYINPFIYEKVCFVCYKVNISISTI
jgi:hypothetical protein